MSLHPRIRRRIYNTLVTAPLVILSFCMISCDVNANTGYGGIKTVNDQKVCPIMTKREVNEQSVTVDYKGVKVRLCCAICIQKWDEDPEAYLDLKFIPQLNDLELPKRETKQVFCPVYRDNKISPKAKSCPTVTYKGKTVYLYNKAALRKWNRDPDKYADATILPQLNDK
ncbi:MAG: hypothetical protein MPJ24_08270 [Pirellulaceae bacterium]|nr:hypothetical protein [Pirellulaceae bacterium]